MREKKKKPVPDRIMRMLETVTIPDPSEIVNEFIDCCGGPRGFAKELWNLAHMVDIPPAVKARVFEMILRLMSRLEMEETKPVGTMSDEELTGNFRDLIDAFLDEEKKGHGKEEAEIHSQTD